MQMTKYFILATENRDIIVHAETGLRVNVLAWRMKDSNPRQESSMFSATTMANGSPLKPKATAAKTSISLKTPSCGMPAISTIPK
jgi:hypothetical protein